MKNNVNEMNWYQVFSILFFLLCIVGSIACGILTNNFLSFIAPFISSALLFFFMYALGEIIKQLRILNANFHNKKN